MYNVVLADDETIVRTSIITLIDWEALGFQLIGNAANGKGILSILENHHVDVVLTDIKMPIMDGIELIKELNTKPKPPLTVVLSAYNDFPLVRNAFKLGASDYILKSDITEKLLTECLLNLKKELDQKGSSKLSPNKPLKNLNLSQSERFREMILGKREIQQQYLYDKYYLVCFEIEDFMQQSSRFEKDIQNTLIEPMCHFAKQIPRVASKCIFSNISPSKYMLCYHSESDEGLEAVESISKQVMTVWKNYMNIYVSAGISSMGQGEISFLSCLQQSYEYLSMKFIFGKEQIYTSVTSEQFHVKAAIDKADQYSCLVHSIKMVNTEKILKEQREFFSNLSTMSLHEAHCECLNLIYHIAVMLAENNDAIWNSFNQDIDFYQKITRLETVRDIEMWLINFIRWIADYIEHKYDHKMSDVMEKAKRFIADHYSDPAITLGAVASFVGFNEKYFSTRFGKETGSSFIAYLTDLRIKKAKEMIERTNMKIYEISEAVGYSNVEHFTRVFKKITGTTPSTYIK
ncbi:MAG: two component transcriptional regulator, AraC family [Clostridia bacterium]|jgi:YesN/AraC family two-component response regulator|nr:two component transcriptional regulator, AraC family [Clostridia bacterium]